MAIKAQFERVFSIVPIRINCEYQFKEKPLLLWGIKRKPENGKLVIEGVYVSKRGGKARGRIVFYYDDDGDLFSINAHLWAVERERKAREEGHGRYSYVFRLLDVYDDVEITRDDTVVTPDGELPIDDALNCLKEKDVKRCVRERAEEYERRGRKEKERRKIYDALAGKIAEMFGAVIEVNDAKRAFRAIDVALTLAEYFGANARSFGAVFEGILRGMRPAVMGGFVVVGDTVVWPMKYAVRPKEKIHVEKVDSVEFKYKVVEYPYGIVAYDAE
ncbi:MAG: hypothetical protein QXP36_00475 [Conexivisphaerales archaeon]